MMAGGISEMWHSVESTAQENMEERLKNRKKTTRQPTATDEPTEIKSSWVDCNKLPKLR